MKHKIYIHEDLAGETFTWNLDVDFFTTVQFIDAEELREYLINQDAGKVDLKYLNTSNNNQSELGEYFNIIIWNFNDEHFNWLIKEEPSKIKFLEVIIKR